jgi:hypothetical protein
MPHFVALLLLLVASWSFRYPPVSVEVCMSFKKTPCHTSTECLNGKEFFFSIRADYGLWRFPSPSLPVEYTHGHLISLLIVCGDGTGFQICITIINVDMVWIACTLETELSP